MAKFIIKKSETLHFNNGWFNIKVKPFEYNGKVIIGFEWGHKEDMDSYHVPVDNNSLLGNENLQKILMISAEVIEVREIPRIRYEDGQVANFLTVRLYEVAPFFGSFIFRPTKIEEVGGYVYIKIETEEFLHNNIRRMSKREKL